MDQPEGYVQGSQQVKCACTKLFAGFNKRHGHGLLHCENPSLKKRKKKKKQIDINHTQEGIGHGHYPAVQVQGKRRNGMWRIDYIMIHTYGSDEVPPATTLDTDSQETQDCQTNHTTLLAVLIPTTPTGCPSDPFPRLRIT
jgi:hypothetical protein